MPRLLKLKELPPSGLCVTKRSILFLFSLLLAAVTPLQAQSVPVTSTGLQVVLIKIKSYPEYSEIRDLLNQTPGVYRVSPRSLTPELLTLGVDTSEDPQNLTSSLQKALQGRYHVTQKPLPSGVTEINVEK